MRQKKVLSTGKSRKHAGFTLIELLIYVALASLVVGAAVVFAWDAIYGSNKARVERDVAQAIRLVSRRIMYEVRNASAVLGVSSEELCLASATPGRNPTRIYREAGQILIAWGGNSTDCTSMVEVHALTGNPIIASQLQFSNYSVSPSSTNIGFELTLESVGARSEWQDTKTYQSSVELRSQ